MYFERGPRLTSHRRNEDGHIDGASFFDITLEQPTKMES